MRMLISVCILTTVSGCAMFPQEPDFPWTAENVPCAKAAVAGVCDDAEVMKAYTMARAYCLQLSQKYEDGGDFINSSSFAIASLGTLAGAVFSPLAGGGAKTAWSGLSGSTNALQATLNTNFSNAVNARRRAEISNSGAAAKDQVARETIPRNQVFAAVDMAYDCKMAVGRADIAVVEAINKIQTGAGTPQDSPSATIKPAETLADAQTKAGAAAKPAALSATAVPIAAGATDKEINTIKQLRALVANAAAGAAASVAASTATETAQKAAAVTGEAPSLTQTQAAAKVAAEAAAKPAATAAAEKKAAQVLVGQPAGIRQAVLDSTAPAASAAASAAADAAAGAAAAPAQPSSSPQ